MEKVLEILGVATAVVIIMQFFRPYAWFVNKVKSIKPFSCELCMCLWTYVVYAVCSYGFSREVVLEAFICAFIGYLVSLKFIKW